MDDQPRRCPWATGGEGRPFDPVMAAYHDDEWGTPVSDEVELFERLVLESFQAGLSWSTILHKRPAFCADFRGFSPAVVAAFDDDDRARLMADAGIVRNRAKIDAAIGNAAAFLSVSREFGGFATYLASMVPGPALPRPPGTTMADLPAATAVAETLSVDLRRRGFGFVGPTIVYAFMQSVGLVDDHLPGCFRHDGSSS